MESRSRGALLKAALRTGVYAAPVVMAIATPITRLGAVTPPAVLRQPTSSSPTAMAQPSAAPSTAHPLPTATPIPVTRIGTVTFLGHTDAMLPFQKAITWEITGFIPFTYFYCIILDPRAMPTPVYSYRRIVTANHGDAAELLSPSAHPILGSGGTNTYVIVFTATDPGASAPTALFPNELLRATFTLTGKPPQPLLPLPTVTGTREP